MVKRIAFIFIGFSLLSCKEINKENISYLVKKWNNKEIVYPGVMNFTILGADTIFLPQSEYRIISYVDSAGCTSCKLKLEQWKMFINKLDSIGNTSVLFFLYPKNRDELTYILKRDNFVYPVCIDEKDSLNKLNHFPSDMMFQTFLIDKDNKVIAIGNPIHNPKVKELYLNIIQGRTLIKEKELVHTKIEVKESVIFLGKFNWQEEQKVIFTIYNVGKHPLVINDVATSCGCTSVDYSKEPIRSGDSISLQVTYKADNPEHFEKTITVYCNANPSFVHLKIVGDAK